MKNKLKEMLLTAKEADIELINVLIQAIDNGVELTKDNVPFDIAEKLFNVDTLSPRQARLILLQYGLLDEIETLIASDKALQIWWEYSLDIQRNDERLLEFATIAGITPEQLNGMFLDGSKL